MAFYHYTQSNSGGVFDFDASAGITMDVVVEAGSASEANARAERIGLYFNGCDTGMDCRCCGDRWGMQWDDKGTEVPTVYGTPVEEYTPSIRWVGDKPHIFVHYADGRIEAFA